MPLSPSTVASMMAQETDNADIVLLTITHPSWTEPIYLSSDPTVFLRNDTETNLPIYGTISRGKEFLYIAMRAIAPDSRQETPPECKISIDNVSRYIAPYLVKTDRRTPKVTFEIVTTAFPDIVDTVYPEFDLSSVTINAQTVDASISLNTASQEPVPWLRFVQAYFYSLFYNG